MSEPQDLASLISRNAEIDETGDTWLSIQKGHKRNSILCATSPQDALMFDGWLKEARSPAKSSASSLTSVKLSQEGSEETKYTTCSMTALKLGNATEDSKKPESSAANYRLFGIDLSNHSNSIVGSEFAVKFPSGKNIMPLEHHSAKLSTPPEDSSEQKLGLSKTPKEPKQFPQDGSREIHGQQNCLARSRIKVNTSSADVIQNWLV